MPQGGNITFKVPKETTRIAHITNMPFGLWKKCRIKSIEIDVPMKTIFIKLLEKFATGETKI